MLIVLLYVIANIALSTALEKNRKSAAVISHALLFFMTFCLLLFFSDSPFVHNPLRDLLGNDEFRWLTEIIAMNDVPVLVPFAIVEVILVVQMVLVAVFFASKVVESLLSGKHRDYEEIHDRQGKFSLPNVVVSQKFYYLFSVLRC